MFLKKYNNILPNHTKTAVLLSVLIHLVIIAVLVFVKFGNMFISEPKYSTINFSNTPFKKKPQEKSNRIKEKQIEKPQIKKKENIITADTLSTTKDTTKINLTEEDRDDRYMKFAQTLLDTFLVRNPQYASLILKEQAKTLAKKEFTREKLIKRINDELHKYIKEHFPEGSEHELNPYTGPGIQIPIDDLIDKIKDIFN